MLSARALPASTRWWPKPSDADSLTTTPASFTASFTFAQVGGLLAQRRSATPADRWGVGVVLGIPLLGTFMVMILLVLIWLESRVDGPMSLTSTMKAAVAFVFLAAPAFSS